MEAFVASLVGWAPYPGDTTKSVTGTLNIARQRYIKARVEFFRA